MTAPSVGAELRRYSALAWTLVATLIVSVALFVQFLRMDHIRAADSFFSSAAHAAMNGGMRLSRLIERLDAMGRDHLLGASDAQLLRLMRALEVDPALVSLCAREGGVVRVLHAAAESLANAGGRCAADFAPSRALVSHRDEEHLRMEFRIIESPPGDVPLLAFRVHAGGSRELRVTLSSTALLDAVVLSKAGLNTDSETVCLSLRVDGSFRELTCHVGEIAAAVPEAFRTISVGAAQFIEEVEAGGLHWRVAVMPDPRSLAGTITLLPFAMFGIALAIGAVTCVFTYWAVDKNILLETRANELCMRLDQLEQLEEQNCLLDQFAAMAAHDLQAPIRFIVSNAYLLIAELDEIDRADLSRLAVAQVEPGGAHACTRARSARVLSSRAEQADDRTGRHACIGRRRGAAAEGARRVREYANRRRSAADRIDV